MRITVRRLTAVAVGLLAVLLLGNAAFARPVSVRLGDTLSGIVHRECGTWDWSGAARDNARTNPNPHLIYAGQTLQINCTGAVRSTVAPRAQVATGSAQRIVNYALAQVGKPYRWAAAGPYAFDCSGLVMRALAQVGVSVPHQDQQILYSGKGYAVSRANLRPGDVVWPYRGHVFIYIGNGKIVESGRGGVKINNLYAFMTARRYT